MLFSLIKYTMYVNIDCDMWRINKEKSNICINLILVFLFFASLNALPSVLPDAVLHKPFINKLYYVSMLFEPQCFDQKKDFPFALQGQMDITFPIGFYLV